MLLREIVARGRRCVTALTLATAFAAVTAGWAVGAYLGWWQVPLVGWLAIIAICLLAVIRCRQLARTASLAPPVRYFWRSLTISSTWLFIGTVFAMYDAIGGPDAPTQRLGILPIACYGIGVLVMQWCLLRLPVGEGNQQGWLQFGLDSSAVMITVAVFVWHFSFRHSDRWAAANGDVGPLMAVLVMSFVCIVAIYKVFALGVGAVDRGVLRTLAIATAAGAVAGALAPFLVGHPYVTDTHLSVPASTMGILLTARRQQRLLNDPELASSAAKPRRRRWSTLPYVAVAALNLLLLVDGQGEDSEVLIVGAIALTTVVVIRQANAFRDNSRLLARLDVTVNDLSAARDQLANQATHDELTGLGNRRVLHERIQAALHAWPATALHLALIDLDDFKTVNDRLGHLVGDELLKAVAGRLCEVVGSQQIVRLGGDEFAVILAPATADEADAVVRRIGDALHRPLRAGDSELVTHASIGVAGAAGCGIGPDAGDARELLRRADVAMYAAKDLGKHRSARYDAEMDRLAAQDAHIAVQLRSAIERNELFLVYQPIVELPNGRATGAEALVRWRHPEQGLVSPAMFIPAAERNGLIVPMGDWILREACQQAARWQREGVSALRRVSVNVSARQLREPEFATTVATILAETGLSPARLAIEVTETAVFDDGPALASVHALHRLGVSIALDDFGTGHSSLGLLRTCPVDILKVDKSFVDEVGTDSDHTVIARSLIQIAEGLRLQAVAEGVETAEQVSELHRLGYRYAQGFYFARPMTPGELTPWLSTQLVARA